jgi:hypothetical protein
MNSRPSFDDLLSEWLEDGPATAPAPILETVAAAVPSIPQRHVLVRLPWRSPPLNMYAKLAVAAVTIVAIGGLGLAVLVPGPSSGPGGPASPSPSPSPTPSPSPPPALTETYTSSVHGISVSYPAGWVPKPATEPWTAGVPQQDSAFVDTIDVTPSNNPFIALISQRLVGKTADRWMGDLLAMGQCRDSEAITVDGNPGVLSPNCFDGAVALVVAQDRGYFIWLYGADDRSWIREVVATVKLHPEDALEPAPEPL